MRRERIERETEVFRPGVVAEQQRIARRRVRQRRLERGARGVVPLRERVAGRAEGVARERRNAAVARDQRRGVARGHAADAERFDLVEQIVERVDAHETRAPEHGRVQRIVGIAAAAAQREHRLVARRRARGRHELARRAHRVHF